MTDVTTNENDTERDIFGDPVLLDRRQCREEIDHGLANISLSLTSECSPEEDVEENYRDFNDAGLSHQAWIRLPNEEHRDTIVATLRSEGYPAEAYGHCDGGVSVYAHTYFNCNKDKLLATARAIAEPLGGTVALQVVP